MESAVYRVIDANFNRAREALRVIEDFCRSKSENVWSNDSDNSGISVRILPNKYIFRLTEEGKLASEKYWDQAGWKKFHDWSIKNGDYLTIEIKNQSGSDVFVNQEDGKFRAVFCYFEQDYYSPVGLENIKTMRDNRYAKHTILLQNGKTINCMYSLYNEVPFFDKPGIYYFKADLGDSIGMGHGLLSNRICFALLPE